VGFVRRALNGEGRPENTFTRSMSFLLPPCKDTPQRIAAIRKLRRKGVGINSIARQLGIGVSVVQRIVAQ
jgi:hypothetical protein